MTKFRCGCGELIRMSGDIPNAHEWHLLADIELEHIYDFLDGKLLTERSTLMYRCHRCGSLWIFWDGIELDQCPQSYVPGTVAVSREVSRDVAAQPETPTRVTARVRS